MRAQLIDAAFRGVTVEYGAIHPNARLRWFRNRILWPIHEWCQENGSPDLTALLVRKGEPPTEHDAETVRHAIEYWQAAQ